MITDRDKNSHNLTQQSPNNNNYNIFNKNINNHLQTQPIYSQKKIISQIKTNRNENPIIINQKRNKQNYSNEKKSKTLFDVKINLNDKTQNKILKEIKKTINLNGLNINKNKINTSINNKQNNKINQKNNNKKFNFHLPISRNRPYTAKYTSKTANINIFNHQKGRSVISNNINFNNNQSKFFILLF